ncbi:hypothetical protein J6590_030787 [Homalodisca vitripennis]|nr:hypothetical protein J6590_030787 [Homalodisca vitripennis]
MDKNGRRNGLCKRDSRAIGHAGDGRKLMGADRAGDSHDRPPEHRSHRPKNPDGPVTRKRLDGDAAATGELRDGALEQPLRILGLNEMELLLLLLWLNCGFGVPEEGGGNDDFNV